MTRADRTRLIFWLVVIVLVFGAYAAEAAFRGRVCENLTSSALVSDSGENWESPTVCS